jgi:hypothetical protein
MILADPAHGVQRPFGLLAPAQDRLHELGVDLARGDANDP